MPDSPNRPATVAGPASRPVQKPEPFTPHQAARTYHLCPVAGCADTIPFGQFSCWHHWSKATPAVRDAATQAWKDYLDRKIDAPALAVRRREIAAGVDDGNGCRVAGAVSVRGAICPDCRREVVMIPLARPDGKPTPFDVDDTGLYVCVAGVANLRPGGVPGKPALARLSPHQESCRAPVSQQAKRPSLPPGAGQPARTALAGAA